MSVCSLKTAVEKKALKNCTQMNRKEETNDMCWGLQYLFCFLPRHLILAGRRRDTEQAYHHLADRDNKNP